MNLINIRDKYRKKIQFFELRDLLNENHVKIFIKGLSGMKTFIVDNNEMFEPIAIEWLDVYRACQPKFEENLFETSVFFTTPTIIKILIMGNTSKSFINDFADSFFEILTRVSVQVSANIFSHRLPVFKMLANKIFDCDVYSHQVTFLEILFRFFNDYRDSQFKDEQQSTPDFVSNELFPNIKNKEGLIEIFLNMTKSSFDTDSRNFLNKLNRCVEPCKIFSIVAESIMINENKLTAPILSNQSYKFWIDFNISVYEMSFPCKGEEDQNHWVTNSIEKEDIAQLNIGGNTTHLELSVNLKNNSNLSAIMTKSINSNLIKVDFTFVLNHETVYLLKNVLPCYQSYLKSNNMDVNLLTPTKEQITKHKHYKKIITPEIIQRANKYDTIIEEEDAEEQKIRDKIIRYASTTVNSFTFNQSFSKSSCSIPINFNILKELAPNPVSQKQKKIIESTNAAKKAVLTNITNTIHKKTPSKVVKSNQENMPNILKELAPNPVSQKQKKIIEATKAAKKVVLTNITNTINKKTPSKLVNSDHERKRRTLSKVGKNVAHITDNSDFDKLKLNGKTSNTRRKLYTKQVMEEGLKGSQGSKEKKMQRKPAKPRNMKKLVNRVVPLQTNKAMKKNNLQNSNYTNSEILQIQANVDAINSGIQNSEEILVAAEPISETNQSCGNNWSSVYDFKNIHRVEIRDEEFISNVVSQVRSQQAPSQTLQQKQIVTSTAVQEKRNVVATDKSALLPVHTSTPLGKINKIVDNKHVTNSYRRFAKSKNSTTKLGYNSNVDYIEPYGEIHLGKSPQPPLRIQGFRQSKAKIKSFCETDSMDELEVSSSQVEHFVVAEVHSKTRNTFTIENKASRIHDRVNYNSEMRNEVNLTRNDNEAIQEITTPMDIAEVYSPETNTTFTVAEKSPRLNNQVNYTPLAKTCVDSNGASNNTIVKVTRNQCNQLTQKIIPNQIDEVYSPKKKKSSNKTVNVDKSSVLQCEPQKQILLSNTKLSEPEIHLVYHEKPNYPIVIQSAKTRENSKPIITMPMPILIDEIKTECIISVDDDSDYENIDQQPQFVVAEVHSKTRNTFTIENKASRIHDRVNYNSEMRNEVNLTRNDNEAIQEITTPMDIAEVYSPETNTTFTVAEKSPRLNNQVNYTPLAKTCVDSNGASNNTIVKVTRNQCNELTQKIIPNQIDEVYSPKKKKSSNKTVNVDKSSVLQCEPQKQILLSNKKLSEPEIHLVYHEKPNYPIVIQSAKTRENSKPIISIMPMPILIDEIKTECIISVDDDSDYENIDEQPQPQENLDQTLHFSLSIQRNSILTRPAPERQLKRKCSETEEGAGTTSEIYEKPKQKRTIVDYDINAVVPLNTNNNNNILSSIKNKLMGEPSKNVDCNTRFSHSNELIRFNTSRENKSSYKRHTIYTGTNIAENRGYQDQLQNLIEMFNVTLENKVHVNEIQSELENIKKARLDKEQSLSLIIAEKTQNLCNKQSKIIRLLGTIKDQESVIKTAYTNLFKKIEKLRQSININRAEVSLEENEINQIRKAEYNLAQHLIETITGHSENIRDEIWRHFVIDLGRNMQQHFFDRYL